MPSQLGAGFLFLWLCAIVASCGTYVKGATSMSYQIIQEPAFFRVVFFDNMTRQDFRSLAVEVAALEDALPVAVNRLTDLSQVSGTEMTYADMLDYVGRRKVQRLANSVKAAIVAPRPLQLGFARMFQILLEHPQIEVQVFATLAEAEAWLACS